MPINAFAETTPLVVVENLSDGSGTGAVAVVSGTQPQSWRIDQIWLSSTSASDHYLGILVDVGGVNTLIGQVKVPAGAGNAAVPAVEALSSILGANNQGLAFPPNPLGSTFGLYVQLAVALASGEFIGLTAQGGYL